MWGELKAHMTYQTLVTTEKTKQGAFQIANFGMKFLKFLNNGSLKYLWIGFRKNYT